MTGDYLVTLLPVNARKEVRLLVELRSRLNPREAIGLCGDQAASRKRSLPLVIACPYVSPRVAEICRAAGVGYLDAAGNCDIRAPGLMLHVNGRPNVVPDTRPLSNLFAPKASRVARLMLTHPDRHWQVKQLAAEGEISIGLASKTKDALIEQGYAVEREGQVSLREPVGLLRAWAAVYKPPRRRTLAYVMEDVPRIEAAVTRWCTDHRIEYALAEYSGAWRLAPMVRYKQASVYLRERASRNVVTELLGALEAKPVESGSNLTVWAIADSSVFVDAREVEGTRVLSPVQLYLDLSAERGRGKEAADELLRRLLEPSFVQSNAWGGLSEEQR